jgi:hypothetical protein
MNYLVLIGDIVSSKQIPQREQTQKILSSELKRLSAGNSHIISPYTITLGDEFQVVFSRADGVFNEAMEILSALHPVKVRFSFGVGQILTQLNREQAIGMDGPAFHNARNGIEKLKNSDTLFTVEGLETPHIRLIQESLSLVSYTCKNWNQNRFRTFTSLVHKKEIQKIAEELHVSDKAVYKTISEGNLHNILRLLSEITLIINENLT